MLLKSGGSEFKPVPQGIHIGVAISVIDLGTHTRTFKNKKTGKPEDNAQRQVYLGWELPHVLYEEGEKKGQPMIVGRTFGASIGDKSTLKPILESWRGQAFTEKEKAGFDIKNVLGKPCQVQILHELKEGKTYANVQNVMGIPPGTAIPAAVNAKLYFTLDNFEQAKYEQLPKWMQEKVAQSHEFVALFSGGTAGDAQEPGTTGGEIGEDEIPF